MTAKDCVGDSAGPETPALNCDATSRALMAIVTDFVDAQNAAHRVAVQLRALAERHGVTVPALDQAAA